MPDYIQPLQQLGNQIEIRMTEMDIINFLDFPIYSLVPGKYRVRMKTVAETQDANGNAVIVSNTPTRTPLPIIEFDPVLYSNVLITRSDNSTFYLGQMFLDLVHVVDMFKVGLPSLEAPDESSSSSEDISISSSSGV